MPRKHPVIACRCCPSITPAPVGTRHSPPRVSPSDGRPSLGGRRRDQRHPGLAGPRQPRHHESLCRDQHPGEGGRPAYLRTTRRCFGSTPPKTRLAHRRILARVAEFALTIMLPRSRDPPTRPSVVGRGHITTTAT